jgi:hypothetical protein
MEGRGPEVDQGVLKPLDLPQILIVVSHVETGDAVSEVQRQWPGDGNGEDEEIGRDEPLAEADGSERARAGRLG